MREKSKKVWTKNGTGNKYKKRETRIKTNARKKQKD